MATWSFEEYFLNFDNPEDSDLICSVIQKYIDEQKISRVLYQKIAKHRNNFQVKQISSSCKKDLLIIKSYF